MKPLQLLNYPGSKARILPDILRRMSRKDIFIEPFLGGGSVLLNVDGFRQHYAGDILPYVVKAIDIISGEQGRFNHAKQCLQRLSLSTPLVPPPDVLRRIRKGNMSSPESYLPFKDRYYRFREEWNSQRNVHDDATIMGFLLLAGACVNNLVRFGKNGNFNQGWGARAFDISRLDKARERLQGRVLTLHIGSFAQLLDDTSHLWPQAFIYLDPPYGGRSEANANGLYGLGTEWTEEDDVKLAEYCKRINAAGGKFLLSNLKENERLMRLMADFEIEELPDLTYKASVGKHARRQQTEVLIGN